MKLKIHRDTKIFMIGVISSMIASIILIQILKLDKIQNIQLNKLNNNLINNNIKR